MQQWSSPPIPGKTREQLCPTLNLVSILSANIPLWYVPKIFVMNTCVGFTAINYMYVFVTIN